MAARISNLDRCQKNYEALALETRLTAGRRVYNGQLEIIRVIMAVESVWASPRAGDEDGQSQGQAGAVMGMGVTGRANCPLNSRR